MKNCTAKLEGRHGFSGIPHSLYGIARLLNGFVLAASLLVTQHTANAAAAGEERASVVSLAAGNADNILLKANPDALYRSSDAGHGWERITLPKTAQEIAAIAVAAVQPDKLYVAGPRFGVLHSDDGGHHWLSRNDGLPSREVVALAAHATQPDTVYAYVSGTGVFRSQDAGAHWRMMDRGPHDRIVGLIHSDMPGSMQTGWLFAATAHGVRRSMDCFCGWQPAGDLKGKMRAVAYDPQQPRRVYAATGKGLFASADGGQQWAALSKPAGGVTALTVGPSGTVYAAVGATIFGSTDQGRTWERTGG